MSNEKYFYLLGISVLSNIIDLSPHMTFVKPPEYMCLYNTVRQKEMEREI